MSSETDSLQRFVFERSNVRGELVHLDAAWQAVLQRHDYPAAVQRPLGEALASVVLLSATLKLDGTLILQIQGEGPLRTLVAQATHERTIRGLARWDGEPEPGDLETLFGDGRLILTIDAGRRDRYQGIVPLAGDGLAAALEGYFAASEQLPTRLWLAISDRRAVGMLLQRLPGASADEDGWQRAAMLAETVREDELLQLGSVDLLHRLFHEEELRLYEPEPVAFRCSCSRTRIADNLRALGRGEIDAIIAEQGRLEITCEFCNRRYGFDPVDARGLFTDAVTSPPPSARQ